MLLPGVGEATIPARLRLGTALALTFMLFPLVRRDYPALSGPPGPLVLLLIEEIAIGLLLGIAGRVLMSALQTAGAIIAQVLGLTLLTSTDPTQGQQGALVGSFLSLVGVTFIFAIDLHYLVFAAIQHSYTIFPPGRMPAAGDAAHYVIGLVSGSFLVAVQLSAPILAFGLIFNVGLGVLARLMPQMQVFFVAVPGSILLGFAVFALVLAAMMGEFASYTRDTLGALTTLGG
jgi:flagellar biosynthetic protein FliR